MKQDLFSPVGPLQGPHLGRREGTYSTVGVKVLLWCRVQTPCVLYLPISLGSRLSAGGRFDLLCISLVG